MGRDTEDGARNGACTIKACAMHSAQASLSVTAQACQHTITLLLVPAYSIVMIRLHNHSFYFACACQQHCFDQAALYLSNALLWKTYRNPAHVTHQ